MKRLPHPQTARIGLVLGAGGVLGGAWMVGALDAMQQETGWDPRLADQIVGTSAGSVLAAALGAGVEVGRLLPMSPDWTFKGLFRDDDELLLHRDAEAGERRLPWTPGSWRMVLSGLRFDGHGPSVLRMLSGLVPRGAASTAPIRETVRQLVPHEWPANPPCWIVACDYSTGRRKVFGPGSGAPLADAVAASCAIPGLYCPQRVSGRLYVDGGLHSMSNLDVLAGSELDLVICLNPLSSDFHERSWDPMDRFLEMLRRLANRQLAEEVRQLERSGIATVVLQPGEADLHLMGSNLMAGRQSRQVVRQAQQTMAGRLREPDCATVLARFGLELRPLRSEAS